MKHRTANFCAPAPAALRTMRGEAVFARALRVNAAAFITVTKTG